MDYLERNGYSYLFRLSSNDYKKERQSMKGADAVVELEHTGPRLQKVGRRHPERLEALRKKGCTQVRILCGHRPGQTDLVLMTNLSQEQYTAEELGELYRKRWGIEQTYHTLKTN